jgi:hypothetical protein
VTRRIGLGGRGNILDRFHPQARQAIRCLFPYYTTLLILVGISNQGETAAIGSDLSSFRI